MTLLLCYHANDLFVVHVKADRGSRLEWPWFLRFAGSISPQAWRCFIGQYIPRNLLPNVTAVRIAPYVTDRLAASCCPCLLMPN